MTSMRTYPAKRRAALVAASAFLVVGLAGCSVLRPTATAPPSFYTLDASANPAPAPLPAAATLPTVVISPPRAAAGFDSSRIIYLREPYKLEYFANSEWVDPPARMLAPLLAGALQASGAFRAVVLTAGAASGDLRLETEIIRLQHDFQVQPSQVRFTLRAHLVEDKTRRVLGWREFEGLVPAASENPYGGVVAANAAVQAVLRDLARFCADTARNTTVAR